MTWWKEIIRYDIIWLFASQNWISGIVGFWIKSIIVFSFWNSTWCLRSRAKKSKLMKIQWPIVRIEWQQKTCIYFGAWKLSYITAVSLGTLVFCFVSIVCVGMAQKYFVEISCVIVASYIKSLIIFAAMYEKWIKWQAMTVTLIPKIFGRWR